MLRLFEACVRSETKIWQHDLPYFEWHTVDTWRAYYEAPEYSSTDPYNRDKIAHFALPNGPFSPDLIEIPQRMKRWNHLLWEHFSPRPRQLLLPIYDYFRPDESSLECLQVKVTPPTAHERLEARLLLRDWFRDEYAAARFAELMEE